MESMGGFWISVPPFLSPQAEKPHPDGGNAGIFVTPSHCPLADEPTPSPMFSPSILVVKSLIPFEELYP